MFKAKVAIEVQYAEEEVIAAIEKNGGTIRTAYYDIYSVYCLSNPERFFRKGMVNCFLFFLLLAKYSFNFFFSIEHS